MTEHEKTISGKVLDDLHYTFEASQFDVDDPREVFAGLVTFRCELLPQLLGTFERSVSRLQRLFLHLFRLEHMFQHISISNESLLECDIMGDEIECKSSSPTIVQHSRIPLEYELAD